MLALLALRTLIDIQHPQHQHQHMKKALIEIFDQPPQHHDNIQHMDKTLIELAGERGGR
jgi:hypothetical protein